MLPIASSASQVTLFGEVLADEFPESTIIGGAPYNVARHLQAFGVQANLISKVGEDGLGNKIKNLFTTVGLTLDGLQTDIAYPTGRVKIAFDNGVHAFDILPDQAYDHINAEAAKAFCKRHLSSLFYFGTLAQRHSTSRETLHALLFQQQGTRFLDINLRPPWYEKETILASLESCDILKVNESELQVLMSMLYIEQRHIQEQIVALTQRFNLQKVIVTLGAEGAMVYEDETKTLYVHGKQSEEVIEIVDTVGAGDAFSAIWLIGKLMEWPIDQLLSRACEFASAVCAIKGATPANDKFYTPFLERWGFLNKTAAN